jgi:hypothetical protein
MSRYRKLTTVCCAAALALGLAACASSDDDTADSTSPVVAPPMDPAPPPDEIAAGTKAAGTKAKAIAAVDTPGDEMGGIGGDDGPYKLSVSRSLEGTTVKVTDSELNGDDDPKFSPMDLGGGRYMVVRTMPADDEGNVVQEVVIVRTDIARPKTPRFTTEYVLNANDVGANVPLDDEEAGDGAVGYALGTGLTDTNPALARMASDDWGAASGASVVHRVDEEDEVDGTFHGASGTYSCFEEAGCSVTVDDKGKLTAASDGWVFYPASGARAVVPDADFLSYGAWLKRTTDADGVLTYNDVETFATSSVDASVTAEVVGTATYEGGAAGVYVHNVLDPAGEIASATGGHFTADATLMATFGQVQDDADVDTIALNMIDTISGAIDNFVLSGDEPQSWSVELERTGFEDDANAPHVGDGVTKGGGDPGTYSATYYGMADADTQPGSVGGEFTAHFNNGSVAGGYGATLQKKN